MIYSIKHYYTNLNLSKKILIIMLVSNILFLGLMVCIGVKIIIPAYHNTFYNNISSELSYSAVQLEHNLKNAVVLSNILLADASLQNDLSLLKEGTPLNLSTFSSLYNTIQTYYIKADNPIVSHISLVSDKNHTQTYPLADTLPDHIQQQVNDLSTAANGACVWITDYGKTYGLFLSRVIRKINQLELTHLGIITLTIDLKPILDSVFDTDLYTNANYLLYDNNNLIYSSTEIMYDIPNIVNLDSHKPYGFITLDKNRYFVVKGTLPTYRWNYFILVNSDDINRSLYLSIFIYCFIIVICILVNIFLCHLLTKPISLHLNFLIERMKQFGSSKDLTITQTNLYSDRLDEIGLLHQQFYEMATEIQELIKWNYLNQLLIKDAELTALENQINPHFLYNTLDSINWRAKQIGDSEISTMVQSLGNLLRITLSSTSLESTIESELKLVNAYIAIQQIRFDERLIFSTEIEDRFLNLPLPKLTLQPIIENAIIHGLEQMIEPCTITLQAIQDKNVLNIYIKNNGPLLEENLLEKLNSTQSTRTTIGLQNINERLKLAFGNDFGLMIYNKETLVVIQICIPLETTGNN